MVFPTTRSFPFLEASLQAMQAQKALAALGYNVKIQVSYEVYYEKDYNVAFDLGYMGAPDHDVAIFDLYDDGEEWTDRETKLEPKAESEHQKNR